MVLHLQTVTDRCFFVRNLSLTVNITQIDLKKQNKKKTPISQARTLTYVLQFSLSTQRKCSFSFQMPSCPVVLWKSQMLLSSSLNTGACSLVSLGLKYSSTSWVEACPSTCAWKATKLRRSTNSSSCSVGGAGEELLPGAPEPASSSSSSSLWLEGMLT